MALKTKSLLAKLEYGPAPESAAPIKEWLAAHDAKFGLFINNEMVHPPGRAYTPAICPSTKETLATLINGDPAEDVDRAVAAAKAAQENVWSKLSGHERAKHLYSIARHIQKHARLFAVLEALENGKTVRETRDVDVPTVVRHFYYHAGWAQLLETEFRDWKPVGVCAQVIPWNFPLLMLAWKVAPALACGNTIVIKPASTTRLTSMLFAEVCVEAGLPAGVVNVLTGRGPLGTAMFTHPDVAKCAFTGSTGVGKELRCATAGLGKKISLELGGKSAVIVYDDADLDSAVEGIVDAIWFNQGQVCCAGSRLLVQESVAQKLKLKLQRRMQNLRVGHCLDKCMDMGAINSQAQLDSIKMYVELARSEGCDVYQASQNELPTNGFYYPPTLISNVQTTSRCVTEEIFGPVLAMMTFRSPKEAVELANNSCFGLGGSVWSESMGTLLDTAFQVRTGAMWLNCHNMFDAAAGFGGYKESGFGREGGKEGLYEYLKPSWMPRVVRSFTKAEKEAKWGDANPPVTPLPGKYALVAAAPSALANKPSAAADGDEQSAAAAAAAAGTGADAAAPAARHTVDKTHKFFIGGKQVRPDAPYARLVLSPDNVRVGEVGEGNRKDIRNAVEAAAAAAPGWGKRAAYNRAQIMYFIAENLDERADEFAAKIHAQTGCGMEAAHREVALSIERLFYWAAWSDKNGGTVQETTLYGGTLSIREAVGVVAICCPDEHPLLGFVSLFAPAIVRGNAIIAVPSEKYPLSVMDLMQVLETSDVPPGVVNIITGTRDVLAKTFASHMNIDGMWYFGPEPIGSYHVEYLSSHNCKRTWVSYGLKRDWTDKQQGQGEEFMYHACQIKNIWCPAGV